MLYKAFISYSHAADGKLAPALQAGLHRFARAWYRLRAVRVFRDKTSLAVTPGLWPAIERALDGAEYFILLASPGAARSAWVEREIDHWLTGRLPSTLLLVLTEGELAWDGAAGDFDWSRTTALPRRLEGVFEHEPLHLDLRWARTEEQLSVRDPRFRGAVAQLASTLHGRPLDELVGEDVQRHRGALRLAWSAVAALVVLTVASALAAWVAVRQRDLAEERLGIAMSRQLAVEALGSEDRLDRALLLAVEANARARTPEAAATLATLLDRASRLEVMLHQPIESFAFGPGGDVLALGLAGGCIQLLDAGDFRPRGDPLCAGAGLPSSLPEPRLTQPAGRPIEEAPATATWLAFTPGGRSLLGVDGSPALFSNLHTVHQWDLGGERPGVLRVDRTHRVTLSPQGHTAALLENWAGESRVLFWSGAGRRAVAPPIVHRAATPIWSVFSDLGDRLIVGYHDGGTELWTGLDGAPRVTALGVDARPVISAVFGAGGDAAFFGTRSGAILRWRLAGEPAEEEALAAHDDGVVALGFAPADGTLLSIGEDGTILTWRLDLPGSPSVEAGRLDPPIAAAVFSRDGSKLAAVERRSAERIGAVELWERPAPRGFMAAAEAFTSVHEGRITGERLPVLPAPPEDVAASELRALMDLGSLRWSFSTPPVGFDPQGERLATLLPGGGLALWNLGDRRSLGWRPPEAVTGFTAAALSPDGRLFGWASDDRVELRDLETGRRLEPIAVEGGVAVAVAFAPDGRSIAFAEYDHGTGRGRLRTVDLATRRATSPPIAIGDQPGAGEQGLGWIVALAFDAGGRRLVTRSYSQELIVWDLETGTALPIGGGVPEIPSGALDLAIHPRRPLLALAADDAVALLDLDTRRVLPEPAFEMPANITSLAFHPAGDLLACGLDDGGVHFRSLATGRPAGPPLAAPAGASAATSLAYDAEGAHLAVAYGTDRGSLVRLWDLRGRRPALPDLAAPAGIWFKVLLSPDRRHLAWAAEGSGPIIWDARLDGWLARACRIANRDLDEAEWRRFLPLEPYRRTCAGLP